MTRRILLGYLTITLVVLVVLEVPLGIFYAQRETDRLSTTTERDANVLATVYEDALERGVAADPAPAEGSAQRTGGRVVVVDAAGTSVVDTDQDIGRDFSTRPEIASALGGRTATGTRHSDTLGADLVYVAVPVASGGTVHGAVRITLDDREVTARIRKFWLGLAGIAVAVLAAMGAVGWTIARSVTRPLRELTVAAARFSEGDLAPTAIDRRAPPEVASLAHALNRMASRLDALIGEQRQFVADASHQLRTPLTALRLRLETLQSQIDDRSSAESAAIDPGDIEAALGEADRLGTLVTDLLALARADRPSRSEAVDLVATTRDRIDTWQAVADSRDVRLLGRFPSAATVTVSVVPSGLEQILDNLLDNAIESGAATVTVTVGPAGGEGTLEIADDGPGLDDADKERALERFWRGRTSSAGSGLGLPIVASLVEASEGRLELNDVEPHGLAVRVRLPRPSVPPRR